jgi:trehalose/maltose hydrolase-like predicted phosphorylase
MMRSVRTIPSTGILDRRVEAVVFDWDGTAVVDRRSDASSVRRVVEHLCAAGMDLAVVSGTNVDNVDGQLGARPAGPGRLYICANRGSEVFEVGAQGPRCVSRRSASSQENAALDAAAAATVDRLRGFGLHAEVVSARLNRRKIDLIPDPAWSDPPKSQIGELVTAVDGRLREVGLKGLPEVVAQATEAATMVGLADARITSDAKYVEIGLTDKADSARWMLSELWRRGIGPELALIVGDEMGPLGGLPGSDSFMLISEAERCTAVSVGVEPGGVPDGVTHLGGGPEAFLSLLDDQLRRRMLLEMPEPNREPGWDLTIDGLDPAKERIHEALLTLSDGRIGTSGIPLGDHPSTTPEVVAGGLYDGEGSEEHLLLCPVWNRLPMEVTQDGEVHRHLDLRTGLLHQEMASSSGRVRAIQFSSLHQPGHVVLRADAPSDVTISGQPLVAPRGPDTETGHEDGRTWMRLRASHGGVVVAAGEREHRDDEGQRSRLERFGVYRIDPTSVPAPEPAVRAVSTAWATGFDVMLAAHRAAWAARWEDADIVIEGDDEMQLAVRFALFHLMGSVADADEAAVGARGLTGPAYRGHVFWDSDVFVLPFLAATHPDAARAMLEYRIRRLPAARTRAAVEGHEGARLPWESARTGTDVTPLLAHDLAGRIRDIRTGLEEIHIVADVAWAAARYLDWSGDDDFGRRGGRELLVETARYWASRIAVDDDGRGHIEAVIGPDEYHESVTDNAFTNVMARWNLRRAARAVSAQPDDPARPEVEPWLDLAATVVDGYDPETGRYEQFAGFSRLEPLVVKDLGIRRPVAADILLGVDRVAAAQIVKQADVLMLHHMVPEETVPGSLLPNLAYYEPRTSHGSSLSPGVHASLLARAGRCDEALEELRVAARIDLEDLTGTTATGLHLATMGSVWQAIAFGFAGLRARGRHLAIDPHLPSAWGALEIRLSFRGTRLRVRMEPGSFTVTSDRPLSVLVGDVQLAAGGDPGTRFHLEGDSWKVVTT